jgi:hypothetical protein
VEEKKKNAEREKKTKHLWTRFFDNTTIFLAYM